LLLVVFLLDSFKIIGQYKRHMITLRNIIAKTPLFLRVVSLYVVIGMIFGLVFQFQTVQNKTSFNIVPVRQEKIIDQPRPTAKAIIKGEPLSIVLERLDINLPIEAGIYNKDTNDWTLSNDAVYYAQITSLPNDQRGITFIYGHNNKFVLGRLGELVVGDVINLTTKNGHTFTYIYSYDAIVPPDLTTVLYDNPESPQLIIMTCEGIWSQTRRLMYFDLQGVI